MSDELPKGFELAPTEAPPDWPRMEEISADFLFGHRVPKRLGVQDLVDEALEVRSAVSQSSEPYCVWATLHAVPGGIVYRLQSRLGWYWSVRTYDEQMRVPGDSPDAEQLYAEGVTPWLAPEPEVEGAHAIERLILELVPSACRGDACHPGCCPRRDVP